LETFQLEFICKCYDQTKFRTHLFPKEHNYSLGHMVDLKEKWA
jgi:hypothetical protein